MWYDILYVGIGYYALFTIFIATLGSILFCQNDDSSFTRKFITLCVGWPVVGFAILIKYVIDSIFSKLSFSDIKTGDDLIHKKEA